VADEPANLSQRDQQQQPPWSGWGSETGRHQSFSKQTGELRESLTERLQRAETSLQPQEREIPKSLQQPQTKQQLEKKAQRTCQRQQEKQGWKIQRGHPIWRRNRSCWRRLRMTECLIERRDVFLSPKTILERLKSPQQPQTKQQQEKKEQGTSQQPLGTRR